MPLISCLKGFPALNDGDWHHLFVGKTPQMGRGRDLVRRVFSRYEQTRIQPIAVLTDGFHTAVFVFAIAVYLTVTIPALKAVVNPAELDPEFTFEQNLGLLGAGNTIIAGLLVLVLVMQARRAIIDKEANEAECFVVFRVDKSTRSGQKPRSWRPRRRKRPRRPSRSKELLDCSIADSCCCLFVYCCRFLSAFMDSRSDSVQRLLSWCSSKRIRVDERLSVIQDETSGNFSVFNLTEEAIPVSQTREYPDYAKDLRIF